MSLMIDLNSIHAEVAVGAKDEVDVDAVAVGGGDFAYDANDDGEVPAVAAIGNEESNHGYLEQH